MYKSIIAYLALGTVLLGAPSCNGENHCYPGYNAGSRHANGVRKETVLSSGTPEEVARDKNVSLDQFLELNEFESDKNPQFGDTVCLPVVKEKFGSLYK